MPMPVAHRAAIAVTASEIRRNNARGNAFGVAIMNPAALASAKGRSKSQSARLPARDVIPPQEYASRASESGER